MSGKVITIAQQKGGAGKTTLAVNLAVAFARAGKRVAVVDTDPQGSLGRWFMTRMEWMGEPDVEFSTSSAWGVDYETRKLVRDHDIVIVDTPPKADSDMRPALRAADLVLVPIASSHLDLWAVEAVVELADRASKPVMLVLTRSRAGTRLNTAIIEEAGKIDAHLADTTIANRVVYAETLGAGRAALEAPKGPAAEEIRNLMAEVERAL